MKDRIKKIRTALGYSQGEFAERLGIGRTAVTQWESGINQVPPAMIISICAVFGVSREYLEKGEGDMFASGRSPMDGLSERYGLSEEDRQVLKAYCGMPSSRRKAVRDFMRSATEGRASMDSAAYSKT